MKFDNVYEFIVWENCNNKCEFCIQDKNNFLSSLQKRMSVELVLNFLNSDQFIPNSHVLILGGELFDHSKYDYELIDYLFANIVRLMIEKKINTLYINTNLLYKNTEPLFNVLEMIDNFNLWDRLHFTTSFDYEYRFQHSEKLEELFWNNVVKIQNSFEKCKIIVNTILTELVVRMILNKEYSVKDFENNHNVVVNLIPYIGRDDKFKPTRKELLKALMLIKDEWSENNFENYVRSMLCPNKKIVHKFDKTENKLVNITCDYSSNCHHSENFKTCYKDSTKCFLCDLERLI